MADDTLGSKDSTWKPKGSAYDVPAVQKGGPTVFERMRRTLIGALLVQLVLALLLVAAAFVTRDAPRTQRLYLWTLVIPAGFSTVFYFAYKRGVKVRAEKTWTREWELREKKVATRTLGAVVAVWALGVIAFQFLF